MKKTKKAFFIFLSLLLFLGLFSVLFFFVPLEDIVSSFGIKNSYIFIFVFALIGGVSSFTSASFYATVAYLGSQGFSPIVLAIVVAPALLLGDYLFYFLGKEGRVSISNESIKKSIDSVSLWFEKKPKTFFPLFIYIYGAFTPFPADILMFSLAFIKYPFKKAMPFILLGHITLISIISLGAFAIFR